MNATHQLGGENYVLWGGREGYETLLNTDLRQGVSRLVALCRWLWTTNTKSVSAARCWLSQNHEEPTKHQYDYDVATVYGFLKQFGLEKDQE